MTGTSSITREPVADRYLDLLKGCITRLLFIDEEVRPVTHMIGWKDRLYQLALPQLDRREMQVVRRTGDRETRLQGLDWPAPPHAESMAGMKRLDNLQRCVEAVLFEGVPGDLIETGVWRGGMGILMRGVLAAYGVENRKVWLADSFRGLPKPDAEKYPDDAGDPHWQYDELAISVDEVKANLARYSLLDDQVEFLVGWFKDTLPTAPIEQLAVLRLDGDMYESTIDGISALYPKVASGGYVIVDDYSNPQTPGCKAAVDDYRREHGINEPIDEIDWTGVFWKKA